MILHTCSNCLWCSLIVDEFLTLMCHVVHKTKNLSHWELIVWKNIAKFHRQVQRSKCWTCLVTQVIRINLHQHVGLPRLFRYYTEDKLLVDFTRIKSVTSPNNINTLIVVLMIQMKGLTLSYSFLRGYPWVF